MCRTGGRRCDCSPTQQRAHNERRRNNRAIRRNGAEWARQNGFAAEADRLAAAPPKEMKDWLREKGMDPEAFLDGVPNLEPGEHAGMPAAAAAEEVPIEAVMDAVAQLRGILAEEAVPGAAAHGGAAAAVAGPGVQAPAAGPGGRGGQQRPDGPPWSTNKWCTSELEGQIQQVMGQQGAHRDERSLLSGTPQKVENLSAGRGGDRGAGAAKGTNTTKYVELDNGLSGYFKPFGGENKMLEKGFGQDSAQQSLHEAAAWRLASQMGPPWSEIVPPAVIREMNGEVGSFAVERPGKTRVHSPWHTGEWREAAFFDSLIGQQDRHPGNYLVAGDRISLIDHGYTFAKPGDRKNYSWFVTERLDKSPTLTYQERDVLQRLLASPDLLGMKGILQQERADALRARAESMLAKGRIQRSY